jgi:hypothetical protein
MKKNTKLYFFFGSLIAIVITSIVIASKAVNQEQEIFQPSLPSVNRKESTTSNDLQAPLVSDPFKSFLDNKTTPQIVSPPKLTSTPGTPVAKDPFKEFLENKKNMESASTVSPFGTSNGKQN